MGLPRTVCAWYQDRMYLKSVDIVGFKREKVENLSVTKKKLTTQQKIERELAYITKAMDLDAPLQKHWYYKLKREYEAQEQREKRFAER